MWSKFIGNFRTLGDDQVAKSYHYGQLRLSRVNWVVRLFRPPPASTGWFYEITYWSITQYVAQATIALVFGFASASLALTSMHVALGASRCIMVSANHSVWATRYAPDVLGFLYYCAVGSRKNLGAASGYPARYTGVATLMGVPNAEKEVWVTRSSNV
jgi:hypothetical protein